MADINKTVQVVIGAKNETSAATTEASKGFTNLQNAASGAAKVIGAGFAVALGAAAKLAKDSFMAFVDSEKQMAQATFTLSNTLDGLSKKQLALLNENSNNAADNLAYLKSEMDAVGKQAIKMGMDDEEASKSFAKLFSITKDVAVAQQEVSLAMDLAAYSGRSLEEATQALTLVHAGGTKVLKEFGLEVDSNISANEALDLVYQKVSGSAEEMASTTSGQIAVLSQSWTNLKEDIGATLAEAVAPFIQTLIDWVNSDQTRKLLTDLAKNIKELAIQLGPLVKELLPMLVQFLNAAVIFARYFILACVDMVKGIGDVINIVKSAVEWFQKLIDKITTAIAKAREWGGGVGSVAVSGATSVVKAAASSNPITNLISNAFSALPKFASGGYVNAPVGTAVPAILHGGETVIPAGGGAGVIVNVSGNMFLDDYAAEKFGNKLVDILKKEIRIGE